eukprot:Rmarinus@m.9058
MSAYKTNIVERKYSRDFLLHFKQFFTDPPEGLPDVAIVRTSTHCRSLTHTLRADEEWVVCLKFLVMVRDFNAFRVVCSNALGHECSPWSLHKEHPRSLALQRRLK